MSAATFTAIDYPESDGEPMGETDRLVDGAYQQIEAEPLGGLMSNELGLRLEFVDDELEFIHPETGMRLLTAEEERYKEAEARKLESEARSGSSKNR